MIHIEKQPSSHHKIRFVDCDPFNHLNNAKYIDYIIEAREDQMLKYYDLDIYALAKNTGTSWVVAQNQIAYLSPARLMEAVVIDTQLIAFDEKTILLEGTMWNADKTKLKAVMWSKQVHFNLRTQRSQHHSDDNLQFFENIHSPLSEPMNFEQRVNTYCNFKNK